MVVVRENHEDLYAGVEYEPGDPQTQSLRDFIHEREGTELREDIGVSITAISVWGRGVRRPDRGQHVQPARLPPRGVRGVRGDPRLRAEVQGPEQGQPFPLMLSGVMMLRHLGERDAADRVEGAIATVLCEAKSVTYDMKPTRDDPSAVGTSEVADAVIVGMGA